jgi:tetratricopeptide (TPR) repeat protein
MKKFVLASLLASAAIASGLPSASAQQPVNLGAPATPCALPDAEYTAYTNAMGQADPKTKAAAIEAYLTAFPQSACPADRPGTLITLMSTYGAINDTVNALSAADRVLQLDPNNFRALFFETYLRRLSGDSATDPAAKLAAYDAAAGFAQKGLVAPKPADTPDAGFKTLQTTAFPIFYSAIGIDALTKKDTATAIDAYKKELAFVPLAQTQTPGPVLQDTFNLGFAYYESTPPDLLDCAFYASRVVAYAPDALKSQYAPTATYCYKTFHGDTTGYDTFSAASAANLNPPDGLFASVKPKPTPADIINGVFATTPDLAVLAPDDREFILQNGTPDQAAKAWESVKGKSAQFPDVLVIASTPTQIQVAVSGDAVQSKTADFTFNLAPPEDTKTAAQAAAAKKKADAIAAAVAVGNKITISGTYDSFTPSPIMITMTDGEVILPEATKTAPKTVHHPVAHKKAQ